MTLSKEQYERYERNISLAEIGEDGQKKLINARVLVIGAGALGSAASLYLAAAGAGTLGLADDDTVALSNLQRQIIHKTSSVGKSKLASAKAAILDLNPDTKVILHEGLVNASNIVKLISDYDFIVDCTDNFKAKFLINDACVAAEKPFSHAGVLAFGGQLMTCLPKKSPCLRCILSDVPKEADAPSARENGILGAVCGIAGSIQAAEAIKYITGTGELLTGRLLKFDTLKMEYRTIKISARNPECPVCGNLQKLI